MILSNYAKELSNGWLKFSSNYYAPVFDIAAIIIKELSLANVSNSAVTTGAQDARFITEKNIEEERREGIRVYLVDPKNSSLTLMK